MSEIRISHQTMRRFVLGRQGLWPGRRWAGKAGTRQAIESLGSLQVDPVHVVARSHDLALWGRVADYHPEHLNTLAYQERLFFDYGTTLFIHPMHEMPYWRTIMHWWDTSSRWMDEFRKKHPHASDAVRAELKSRGPLPQRAINGEKVTSYRARKDTGLALHYLWLSGELMTHSRAGFDRVFYFRESIVPEQYHHMATEDETRAYFARQVFREMSLVSATEWTYRFRVMNEKPVAPADARNLLAKMVKSGDVTLLTVDGRKGDCYVLTDDLPVVEQLERGELPEGWSPLGTSTQDEVVFLSPLDMVSARGRAERVFNFEYIWEIYKKPEQRRWGYYTLPILYGDHLVGRIDCKLDRAGKRMIVNGLWLEDDALAKEAVFADALSRCMVNFTRFHGAQSADLAGVSFAPLKRRLTKELKAL